MRNIIQLSIQKKQFYISLFSFFVLYITALSTGYAQNAKTKVNTNQQTFTVSGTVLNALDNEPLPGTSIHLKNSTQGVETDINGNFEIKNIKNGDTISLSFLGFEKQDFIFNENTPFVKIYLKESSFQLLGAVDTKSTYKTKRSFWQLVKSIF